MKKRVMSVFLTIVILIALLPTGVSASTTKTKENAIAWLDSLVGTKVGSGQCVALIKAYYEYLGAPTPYGNGCDYATNSLPSGWQRIEGATPQVGDILVWTQGYENYGHVAICGGDNKYFHQNWSGLYVQVLNKSYTSGFSVSSGKYYANYWGVIRPDFYEGSHDVHTFDEYVYYWDSHPHYNCYKCSCGEVKARNSETNYISTCSDCNYNLSSGKYFIRNKGDGNYLNIAYGSDQDETAIHTYAYGNYDSQVYNIYKVDDGYEMMPLCSKTRVVNPYCWTVESGKTVNLYSKTNESSQWWKFQPMKDGYVIRNVQNPKVCLTPSNNGMIVSEYTGSDKQIWILEKVCTIKYDANGGSGAPLSERVRAGYKTALSAQKPTRSGQRFLGWSSLKNAKTPTWNISRTVTVRDSITLYAVWEKNHTYSNSCDKTCNTCGATRNTSHSYKTTKVKATLTKNGKITHTCKTCGYVASTSKTIKYVKTVKLSATSYTYNGKVKTPTVTVKDSSGMILKKNTDYTVSYSSGRKNVGTYKVTITFRGKYSGTKVLTFKINPKSASVNKLTAKTKGLTVKLNRQTVQSTGYEIQYATSKTFKSAKTTTASHSTSTKSISGLKAKTTYYVRVRTYKTVSGVKYYSNWSTAKYMKTK